MEIDLERGFAPWKEMFIDNEYKLNEHGGKLVFAGTEKDNPTQYKSSKNSTKDRLFFLWNINIILLKRRY